jgi:hypothetical protein
MDSGQLRRVRHTSRASSSICAVLEASALIAIGACLSGGFYTVSDKKADAKLTTWAAEKGMVIESVSRRKMPVSREFKVPELGTSLYDVRVKSNGGVEEDGVVRVRPFSLSSQKVVAELKPAEAPFVKPLGGVKR